MINLIRKHRGFDDATTDSPILIDCEYRVLMQAHTILIQNVYPFRLTEPVCGDYGNTSKNSRLARDALITTPCLSVDDISA